MSETELTALRAAVYAAMHRHEMTGGEYTDDSPAATWIKTGVFEDDCDCDELRVSFDGEDAVVELLARAREEMAKERSEVAKWADRREHEYATAFGKDHPAAWAFRECAAFVRSRSKP